uniref:HTH-type transcriptional regulator / antitoxin HigA n=1 Tax=Candidatus Kentrum sp. FM TaxID=2126340 RepID=A0A450VS26_9GAMM|nr:MAG: HTH-type transcriptional regulator / antitoxin HigA [Candidatus Kentron sp. FM]VFJ48683.1 MAG: HTH-type transcriptional regulator / antitoxin HigA [Candidatus Kentron sp. FM]VFK07583.1 MAG: HTH-type transcriptional regulator / antitoxin HigA [Candidatus Kentron sp. FM]
MGHVQIIKTAEEHQQALARVSVLMDNDPAPDSPEADQLQLLAGRILHLGEERNIH